VIIREQRALGEDFGTESTHDAAVRTRLGQGFARQPVDVAEKAVEPWCFTDQVLGQVGARGGGAHEGRVPGRIGYHAITLYLQDLVELEQVGRQQQRRTTAQVLEQTVAGIAIPGIAEAGKRADKTEGHYLGPATGVEVDRQAGMLVLQLGSEFPSVATDVSEIMVGRMLGDAYCIGRPAGIVQDTAELQRTLARQFRVAGRNDHLRRPQAQGGQSVLHDFL
jgi:hypothetical protein